jgi:hypothetical protein
MKPYYKYIAAAIAALVILRSLTKSNFKKKLVKLANEELQRWNNGNIKEGNAALMPALRNYWKVGSKTNASDSFYINNAWSATFVSYLMRQAGAGDNWKYSALHSDYIQAAKKNRKNNVKTFQAFRKNETPVSVGDLICYPRQDGVTYDTPGGYYAHCDIITDIKPGTAVTVGGNVSDSVKQSVYKLDGNNKVITEKVHAVIKTLI